MFPLVGFVAYTNSAQAVIILEYANTEDVHVQKDSNMLSLPAKKVMLISYLKTIFISLGYAFACLK